MIPEAPVNAEIKEDQLGIERALWQAIKEAEAKDRARGLRGDERHQALQGSL